MVLKFGENFKFSFILVDNINAEEHLTELTQQRNRNHAI